MALPISQSPLCYSPAQGALVYSRPGTELPPAPSAAPSRLAAGGICAGARARGEPPFPRRVHVAARAPPTPLLSSSHPNRCARRGRGGGASARTCAAPSAPRAERWRAAASEGPCEPRLPSSGRAQVCACRGGAAWGLRCPRGVCEDLGGPRAPLPHPPSGRGFPYRGSGKDRRPLTRNAHRGSGCGIAALRRCEAGSCVVVLFPQRGSVLGQLWVPSRPPHPVCGAVYVTSALPAGGAARGAALSGRCPQCCVRAVKRCLSVEEPGLK